ncbi:hydrolase [Actinomadura spongiicola]|uniref:Hydrolase n=2 Tax=Actinomadura spongiicola TaxID=2303421 RepID=A0A372G808_9ACTN|nr:hydrolase [Actinomadura spongiicola]
MPETPMRAPVSRKRVGPRALSGDTGAVQLWLAVAAGALMVLVAVFLGAGTGSDTSPAGCLPQPGTSDEAEGTIPANYLALYRKVGNESGIPWTILAGIGKVESDHGRDLRPGSGVRSGANLAGAAGPMQIGIGGKATDNWGGPPRQRWQDRERDGGFAIDGNGDGWANVYDPSDAIPAAANMLKAYGAPTNIPNALLRYNGSTEYIGKVLNWARRYAHDSVQTITAANNVSCQPGGVPAQPASGTAAKVITYARAQLGKPYIWGADGPDAYDCSGLTMMAYRAAGISIPRTTFDQWRHGTHIRRGNQQPGDLVFFNSGPGSSPSNPGHVGIVLNAHQMINARCTTCRPGIAVDSYGRRADLVGFVRPTQR